MINLNTGMRRYSGPEEPAVADTIRVCMILEGSYPYITGGVGAWVHDIIGGLPDIEFSLLTLSPKADQPLRYTLPANVVEHKDIVLSAALAEPRRKTSKPVVDSVLEMHEKMFSGRAPDIMGLLASRRSPEDLGNALLAKDRLWSMLATMNGKRNPAAAIMFALLAEMARAERETLSERIKSGLEEAKRKGRKLGRPAGAAHSEKEFLAKHADIVRRLKEGHSVRNAAKITGKGVSTVQRVKKLKFASACA